MKEIICVMGKSCAGKSTRIEHLVNQFHDKFYIVKSYSDRAIRENDPNDIKTHTFVSKETFESHRDNGKILSLYTSPQGYHNWTTEESFSQDKINLYAIDAIAYVELFDTLKDWDVSGIYHNISEDIRRDRYIARNNTLEGFDEPHLDISNIPNLDDYKVVLLYD